MKLAEAKPISLRTADALRWTGLVLGLTPVVLRAMTTVSPLPYWDLDPLFYPTAMTGLGPGGSLLLDSITVIGAEIILLAELLAGRVLSLTCLLLTFAGAFRAIFPGDSGPGFIGMSWTSGMILAAALFHLCRDDRFRIAVLAVIVGFVMVLAARGAQQVFIEHPETVADFRRGRDAFFAAQGWSPDSPMARAYVRRLEQSEATGWFGLANVYASFAAAGVVALASLVATGFASLRAAYSRLPVALLCLALALSIAALVFAGGKGGFLAAILGLAATTTLAILTRPRSLPLPPPAGEVAESARPVRVLLATLLGPALALATLALVLLRGLFGDHLHALDLSLLFRFHYLQAATRIFLAHPIAGVGPDGFQQAYLLAKNPLNPEEVSSPHNILAEWPATLGMFGLAWVTLCVGAVALCGRAAVQAPPSEAATHQLPTVRTLFRAVAAIGAIATLAAAYLEQAAATPDSALVRLGGLALWCATGWAVLRVAHSGSNTLWRYGLAGAAIALACHSLIDVTASWPGSAALYLAMLGASAAPRSLTLRPKSPRRLGLETVFAGIVLLVGVDIFRDGAIRSLRWEHKLAAAATEVRPLAELSQQSREAQAAIAAGAARPSEALRTLAASVSAAVGRPVNPDPASIERAMIDLELRLVPRAIARLDEAIAIFPGQWKIKREASRLCLRLAERSRAVEPDHRAASYRHLDDCLARVSPSLLSPDAPAPELAWVALALQSADSLRPDPVLLTDAAYALEKAAALDPHGLEYPKRLMRLYTQLNRPDKAAAWARRTLEVNALMRLDPEVKGLTESERAEAARLAGQP